MAKTKTKTNEQIFREILYMVNKLDYIVHSTTITPTEIVEKCKKEFDFWRKTE